MVEKGEWLVLQKLIQSWSVNEAQPNSSSFVLGILFFCVSLPVPFDSVVTGEEGDTVGVIRP